MHNNLINNFPNGMLILAQKIYYFKHILIKINKNKKCTKCFKKRTKNDTQIVPKNDTKIDSKNDSKIDHSGTPKRGVLCHALNGIIKGIPEKKGSHWTIYCPMDSLFPGIG